MKKRFMSKGQASVEMLVLMSVALMMLVLFIGVMWDQVFVQRAIEDQKEAYFAANLAQELYLELKKSGLYKTLEAQEPKLSGNCATKKSNY